MLGLDDPEEERRRKRGRPQLGFNIIGGDLVMGFLDEIYPLRSTGTIGGHMASILVDLGSCPNFITQSFARRHGFAQKPA